MLLSFTLCTSLIIIQQPACLIHYEQQGISSVVEDQSNFEVSFSSDLVTHSIMVHNCEDQNHQNATSSSTNLSLRALHSVQLLLQQSGLDGDSSHNLRTSMDLLTKLHGILSQRWNMAQFVFAMIIHHPSAIFSVAKWNHPNV